MTSEPDTPRATLAVRGLTKRFGSVVACDNVDLELAAGQIHGVLGENGAGKSTLMKVLIGLVQPDEGTILLRGSVTRIDDPRRAAEMGIAMVHQHFSLVPELRVWENVVLGDPAVFDADRARRLVAEIGDRYGLVVEPDAYVGDLTVGLRQRVEIIKCLRRDPEIVIFDEPTAVLTPQESAQLFDVLRVAVEREGKAVALVSHKLAEIQRATDVVTVMRRGQVVDAGPSEAFTANSLAEAMVGRPVVLRSEAAVLGLSDEVVAQAVADTRPERFGDPVLEIDGATRRAGDGRVELDGLSLTVRAGEIVGIAGVEGNGQVPLANVLSSLDRLDSGTVRVGSVEVPTGQPGAMGAARVAIIPEDRHDAGCVLDFSVANNLSLNQFGTGTGLRLVDRSAILARAEKLIDEFGIRCSSPDAPMSSLSGGNQQRVVLARELAADPLVLVACQPTRGLDVGAAEYVTERLRQAAADGVGVLLISSELEEILDLSDRVLVVHEGRIVGDMPRSEAVPERLGLLMGGSSVEEVA